MALIAMWVGDLNMIAPVLTMFFLTTHGVLNIAAGIEGFRKSPSFRPQFKVHWSLSDLGASSRIAVMVLINATAPLVAAMFVGGIFVWLERRNLKGTWGDVRRGLWPASVQLDAWASSPIFLSMVVLRLGVGTLGLSYIPGCPAP